jgi:ferredoxin-NADP reductase
MKNHYVKIKSIQHITHDVLQIDTEKPHQFTFIPGQGTSVCINKKGWENKKRPFTFTSLPQDDYLQFIIKTYSSNNRVTDKLLQLKPNDELILHDVFGTITYNHEGLFIAGGAGITPFISILRDLKSKNEIGDNKLIFANKTKSDIILKDELTGMLGDNFINILSEEKAEGYPYGFITEDFLRTNVPEITGNIYLCGPPAMINAMEIILPSLNIDEKLIIKEKY